MGARLPMAANGGGGIAAAAGRLGALVCGGVERQCAGGAATPGSTLQLACSGRDRGAAVAVAVDGREVGTSSWWGRRCAGSSWTGMGLPQRSG